MFPAGRVMAVQRTEADHATPFFPRWRPSTTLTGIDIGLAMLIMAPSECSPSPYHRHASGLESMGGGSDPHVTTTTGT